MALTTYAGDFVTVKYWDFEDDPVYAESTDSGNTSGWGINHNWRALVDGIDAIHDGLEFTTQASNPLSDAGLWIETTSDLLVLQDILGITLTNNLVINEDGDDYDIRIEGDTEANLVYIDAGNDRVGIGTNTPSVLFEVGGNTVIDGNATINYQCSVNGAFTFNENGADADFRAEGDTDPNLFFLDASTDRVGIGTNTPSVKFDVVGNALITGTVTLNGAVVINENGADVDTRIEGDTEANLFFVDASTDRIGIGTATPSVQFETTSAGKIGGALTVMGQGGFDGGVIINEGGYDNDTRIEGDTNANLFFVDASADMIGIGINNPATLLDVDGDISCDNIWSRGDEALDIKTPNAGAGTSQTIGIQTGTGETSGSILIQTGLGTSASGDILIKIQDDTGNITLYADNDMVLLQNAPTGGTALAIATCGYADSVVSGYLKADGTISLSADWDAGSYKITAEQLESDVAGGTAPLIVASNTVVANLNADLLDGIEASAFMQDLVNDTTPQLGGDLDLNGHNIDFPTVANVSDCKDEDDMASNSATMLATQQSIKAYVDNSIDDIVRVVTVQISDPNGNALSTGDGKAYYRIPYELNGWNLIGVASAVTTVSTSGTPEVQIYNLTQTADMLSTTLTIDANETDSSTATTPAVIDTGEDDVTTADMLRFDVDTAGTGTKGLMVELRFQKP